jgi:hypothetical protein
MVTKVEESAVAIVSFDDFFPRVHGEAHEVSAAELDYPSLLEPFQ